MSIIQLNAALDQVAPALPARFQFSMAGAVFSVRAEADGETGCHVVLDVDLGRIPFSAEAPETRSHKLALLGLPDARFSNRAGRLLVSTEMRLDTLPTHRRLVAVALSLALSLRPEVLLGSTSPPSVTRRPVASRLPAWAA